MKGLLLKDTYMAVRLCRMFLLLDVVFLGVWMFGDGDLFFLTYPCLLTTMVAMTLISYCLLYTSPSPRDRTRSRMPSSA